MKNKHAGGRPALPESQRRCRVLQTKVSKMEMQIIQARAKSANLSLYDYVRQSVLTAKVIVPYTAEELALLKSLAIDIRNIGNNINQLAYHLNAHMESDALNKLRSLVAEATKIKVKYTLKLLGKT